MDGLLKIIKLLIMYTMEDVKCQRIKLKNFG
jgi:hypothetical protein